MVYDCFQDFSLFADKVPEDKKDQISFQKDRIVGKMQGMEFGIEVVERVPFSEIRCRQYGSSPLQFTACIHIVPVEGACDLSIELEPQLPLFLRPMIEPKLKDFVQQFSEQVAMALNKA